MSKILAIKGREILDSRGIPTLEAEVRTEDGTFLAAVPSGSSAGTHEAHELRDADKNRYGGKGVLKAVSNINAILAPLLKGKDPTKQKELDDLMITLDSTKNKSKLGANTILGVSIAICKAGAAAKRLPLYKYIGQLSNNSQFIMPVPMILVMEGGKHADQSSDLQEFMVVPKKAGSFKEALRQGEEIYFAIKNILKKQKYNTNVGYEGAFAPTLSSNEKALQIIVQGIKEAGYHSRIKIAIDAAASEFHKNGDYELKSEDEKLTSVELIHMYESLYKSYPIYSLEDGLSEDDWNSWQLLMKKMGNKMQIVGDDLTVTNPERIQKAVQMKALNSVLIKLNQIGSVSETIEAVNLCKKNNYSAIISHRSGETEDTFIADFVVGTGTGQCKFGAPVRGERTAKYNRLLRIEEELGNAKYGKSN